MSSLRCGQVTFLSSANLSLFSRRSELLKASFKLKKRLFFGSARRIARQSSPCSKYSVAGNDEGNSVVADRIAYCLGGHWHASLAGKKMGNFSVGDGFPVGNGEEDLQDPFTECASLHGEERRKTGVFSAEIGEKPLFCALKEGIVFFRGEKGSERGCIFFKPEACEGMAVTCKEYSSKRGIIVREVFHRRAYRAGSFLFGRRINEARDLS